MVACIFCNNIVRTKDGKVYCEKGNGVNPIECDDFIIRTKNLINLSR